MPGGRAGPVRGAYDPRPVTLSPPATERAPSGPPPERRGHRAAVALGRVPRPAPATVVLLVGVLAHAVVYARLALLRQEAFWHARFDLGNMVQAVWSTAHGDPLSTTTARGEQISRLAAHVDPLIAVLAPLWWIWPSPDMLLVVQAVAVALGALPLYWLGRLWLDSDVLALAGPAAYLLNPALGWATVTEFHPVTLAPPLILFAVWAAATRRDAALVVFAALALLAKENVGLGMALLGVWIAFSLGRRRAGLVLSAVSLAWVATAIWVIIPRANEGPSVFIAGRYGDFGETPGDVIRGLVTRPDQAVTAILEAERISYLLALALPLAGLFLLAPLLAAGALPDTLLNVLSSRLEQHQVEYHYTAVIVPFLVVGAVRGIAWLRARPPASPLGPLARRPWIPAAALVGATLAGGWHLGPLPVWSHLGGSDWRNNEYVVDTHARVLARAVALVPADGDVVVSATNHVGAHLSARRRIYLFPTVLDAEWVVIDRRRPETALGVTEADLARGLSAMLARDDMERVFHQDGVSVFRRVGQQTGARHTSRALRAISSATGTAANSSVRAT